MKTVAVWTFVLLFPVSGFVGAESSEPVVQGQTQSMMNKGACEEFKNASDKLEKMYQSILKDKAYAKKSDFLLAFQKSQRRWQAYQAAQVEALFPGTGGGAEQGSVLTMCDCQAMTRLTNQRIEAIQDWVTGIQEGDVCSGSRKFKK